MRAGSLGAAHRDGARVAVLPARRCGFSARWWAARLSTRRLLSSETGRPSRGPLLFLSPVRWLWDYLTERGDAACGRPARIRCSSEPAPFRLPSWWVWRWYPRASASLGQLLYQQDANVVVGVIVGTKFAAVLLFVAVAGLLGSAFVATLAKTLITFATAAFLVFLAQGGYSPLSSALMSTGYSLFEMTTYLVLAELALSLRVRPLSLLSGFYLIETVGYLLGCSLEAATGPGGLDRRMVAAVLALALLICAVWVFTEKHVNDLLWGRGDGSAGGDAVRRQEIDIDAGVLGSLTGGHRGGGEALHGEGCRLEDASGESASSPYGRGVARVSERFRLSPRETEGAAPVRRRPLCCLHRRAAVRHHQHRALSYQAHLWKMRCSFPPRTHHSHRARR